MIYKIKNVKYNIDAQTIDISDENLKVFYSVIISVNPSISESEQLSIYDENDNYMYKVFTQNNQIVRQT